MAMTPARFIECLIVIRWTPINLASALQCDLSWVEAMEVGNEEIPDGLAVWLENLARVHTDQPPPKSFRGKRSRL
ncbi:hypothetical protein J2Y63_001608 [Shinella sp. BE166]